tara:strand:- start:260 stop:436 length:177 start_codon:yes stop_codon:yes gene_type:complete
MPYKKNERPKSEDDDLTKEKVTETEHSGLGKTLLTSKPSDEEDTKDEKQRKTGYASQY